MRTFKSLEDKKNTVLEEIRIGNTSASQISDSLLEQGYDWKHVNPRALRMFIYHELEMKHVKPVYKEKGGAKRYEIL